MGVARRRREFAKQLGDGQREGLGFLEEGRVDLALVPRVDVVHLLDLR